MPGVSVNPLLPPGWWTLPARDWIARRHVGPDNEPLLVDLVPIAWLSAELVATRTTTTGGHWTPGRETH